MQETTYALKIAVALPWDAALARTTEALKAEGFGVLTTIDVQATLRTKLDRAFRKYVTLGACSPALADRALQAELEIGLLLRSPLWLRPPEAPLFSRQVPCVRKRRRHAPMWSSILSDEGERSLPLILVNESIVSRGTYLSRAQLARAVGQGQPWERSAA